MSKEKKRFYTPDVDGWKFHNDKNTEETADSDSIDREEISPVSDNTQKTTIKKHFEFFNWTLSFTKNVVQACFILFLIVNIFIAAMITYVYINTRQVVALEIYISEIFNMFITVIGGYIIKSTTENTIKIVFSVLSDWLEKKYGIEGRLKEPEEESDTFIFTGNRPTPQSGVLADGSSAEIGDMGEGFYGEDQSGGDNIEDGTSIVSDSDSSNDDPDSEG